MFHAHKVARLCLENYALWAGAVFLSRAVWEFLEAGLAGKVAF